jgi:oligoendopeptidase F
VIEIPTRPDRLMRFEWSDFQRIYDALAAEPLDADAADEWLARWAQFEDALAEAREQVHFDYTCNTADAEAEALNLKFQTEIEPRAEEQRVRLSERLLATGYSRPDLVESLRRFRTTRDIFRPENVRLLGEIQGLNAEYEKITGAMTAVWEGEEIPLPRLRPFMLDPDRSTRERAWRLHRKPYVDQRDRLADLFTQQYRLRRDVARHAGFDSFRDFVHTEKHRYDYTPADCYAFHEAVLEVAVPASRRILDSWRSQMGLETLRPWDVGVDPQGRPPLRPFSDDAEFRRRAADIFDRVDPELADRFRIMDSEGLLDLASRKGKAPGGYMTDLPVRRRPLIFMNASGVADDVVTLVHESGHAFQGFEQFDNGLIFCQRWPGMEMAEVGSMAMELLSAPFWHSDTGGYYSDEDYRRARIDHLQRAILFFPHCASVDAFQHWIYTDPEGEDAEARDAHWLKLRRQYEPGVDYSDLEAEWIARWYQQLHIFELPFYYIEYGIAQLGAIQIWRNAMKDQAKAVAAYRRALGLGSTRPLPELFAEADARLAFDRQTMADLIGLVEEELERLQAG